MIKAGTKELILPCKDSRMHFFFKLLADQSLMASAGQTAPARPEKPQSRP